MAEPHRDAPAETWREYAVELERELAEARRAARASRPKRDWSWIGRLWSQIWTEDAAANVAALMLLLCVLFGLYCGVRAVLADSHVTYCYVGTEGGERDPPKGSVELQGNIEWRPDRSLGIYPSVNDAVKAAELLNCPLK